MIPYGDEFGFDGIEELSVAYRVSGRLVKRLEPNVSANNNYALAA